MSDLTDITTLTVVDTFHFEKANSNFTQCTSYLNKYTGTGNYIVIGCSRSGITTNVYFCVDDVRLDSLPSCFDTKTPTLRVVTGTTATIEWVPNGNETQWQAQYQNADSTSWIDYPTILTADTFVLTGLTANTAYNFRVRAYCGAADQSNWSNTLSFTTDCAEYISIPFYANFDNEETGGANGTTYPNFVHCWSRLNDGSNANYTGYPYVDAVVAHQRSKTGKCLYFNQYAATYGPTYPTCEMAILPPVDPMMDPVNTLQLNFWAKKSTTNMPLRMIVGVMTDPTADSTFVPVDTIDYLTVSDNTYRYYSVALHNYQGDGAYVAIKIPRNIAGVTTSTSANNIYLDDVELVYGPTCFVPGDLHTDTVTASSATIDWTPGDLETEWNIRYKAVNDAEWTVVPGTVTKPYTIQNLATYTGYEVQVRSHCSATDSSDWTSSYTFYTACGPRTPEQLGVISFEANEGFTTGAGKMAACWTVANIQNPTSTTTIPYVMNGSSYAHTGTASLLLYSYGYNSSSFDSAYAAMPELSLADPLTTYNLEFYMRKAGTNSATNDYIDTLYVGVMSDPADFSTYQNVGYVVNSTTTYQKMAVSFANTGISNGYITFLAKYNQNATTTYKRAKFYVDDISLVQARYAISVTVNDSAMGTVSQTADSLPMGRIDTIVATPAANYHFVRWSNGDTNSTLLYTVTGDTAFTAYFAPDTFAVSVAVTGAAYGSVTNDAGVTATPAYYPYGTVINFTAVPAAHADFIGWSDATTALTTSYTVAADTIIGATFANHAYSIAATADTTMGTATVSAATAYFGDAVTFTATPAANYHFVRWSNGETNASFSLTVAGDTTLTAYFALDTFAVSIAVTGAEYGSVTNDAGVTATPAYYPYGTVINFTAAPADHADFIGWSDATTALTTSYTVIADTVIGATFANHAYTVTVATSDVTMGTATASAATAFFGDTVVVTATAELGYQFTGWSNGDSTDVAYIVIASDTTITANFDYIRYNVSATSADTAMGVVVDITEFAEYHYGDVATFRAVPNDGYEFVEWSNGETTEEINVTITSDTALVATFREVQVGVDDVNNTEYIVYADQMTIVLHGAANKAAACYDAAGRMVSAVDSAAEDQNFAVQMPGVYFIRIDNTTISVVVK